MIHGHGDDQYKFPFQLKADFSSNVRFDGCPIELINHLKNNLHLISNYPEPDGESLRKLIAQKHEIKSKQVILCNGSSDGFYQIAQTFEGFRSAILQPSFSEYEDACRLYKHQLKFFTKEEFTKQSFSDVDLVWLGNPNNPDGYIFDLQKIREQLGASPETIFIIDEAYIELCKNADSAIPLINKFDNLIVCRSLTKTYGIPGIRLGYLISSPKVSDSLKRFLKPWTVNSLALETGKYILQNEDELKPDTAKICQLSKKLQERINRISGMKVHQSQTGFFLVELQKGNAKELKKYLLDKHQILIRDASNFRGLNDRFFRIGIQSEEKNKLLLNSLVQFSEKYMLPENQMR